MPVLGAITIGQSPRDDLVPDMKKILGPAWTVRECGALDDLEPTDLPRSREGEKMYVTRLRCGKEVKVQQSFLVPLLQECVHHLEPHVDILVLLCTGPLPPMRHTKILLEPSRIVRGMVPLLCAEGPVGIVVPHREQIAFLQEEWEKRGVNAELVAVSPYERNTGWEHIVPKLANMNMIVLDCMGYDEGMKKELIHQTQKPVVLPRQLLAAILGTLL